ncbi:hypothetical protein EMIHUDRAFT_244220 [Emiliania huxleyi CCMP1516]|uniref:SMP-LTD domain-containing protein n=2 Tax=Emiliania huxleyi TaxID=2903 RepID=A0A0D3J166_EMIH1|nr:hypothetical protein EMIHUDRAFT_244220 [Emiliania huxleyi CCMP1516]EOD17251.1 hypothetical protein EMIHUDRAFT_244220 [Emiliania huxleyi CCMP1516]|eukprot:XP_005769680.1 hypothetical protein EMIHUDRAFT_244220 [Emiliania huxleyi CCMP1516]
MTEVASSPPLPASAPASIRSPIRSPKSPFAGLKKRASTGAATVKKAAKGSAEKAKGAAKAATKAAVSATDRAATRVQANVRRCSSTVWLAMLDAADRACDSAGLKVMRDRLVKMGAAGGTACANVVMALSGASGPGAAMRRRALIKLFRTSVALALLPRYLTPIRREVQRTMSAIHNSGVPMPLGDEGLLANYSLEVLRMDAEGRLWRRKVGEAGAARYERVGAAGCLPQQCSRAPPAFGEKPPPVSARGIIKRLAVRIEPRIVRPPKGWKKAREAAEDDLASLDIDYPPDFMPRAMRDKPNEVLALDLDLDFAVRFDSREELSSDCKPDHEWAECMQCWRARLVLFARGHNGLPSLGTLELRSLRLAFKKDAPPVIDWNIEVAMGTPRLPLPSCIEDAFLAWLTGMVMRSFNRAYPLKVDLDASSTAKEGSECDEEEVRGEEEEVVKDATLDLASAKA